MSDPFANLLSSFKSETGTVKKDDKIMQDSQVLQPAKKWDNGTNSSLVSPRVGSPAVHDDFGELFGSSGSPMADLAQNQVVEDDFDAAFKAFDEDFSVTPQQVEPELVVDEVRDMEVAKLMSLDLSIEKATSYYDRGILYEELVRRQREKETIRAQRARVRTPLRAEEPTGFFSVASGLLEKGKQLVDQFTTFPEEQDRLSGRMSQYSERVGSPVYPKKRPSVERKQLSDELPAEFRETFILDDDPLPKIQKPPTPTPPPESTLLDFDNDETVSSVITGSVTPVPISHLELSGYNEFKDRATTLFKAGDYVAAREEYEKSLNSLPQGHALRIVAHSNLVASLLKTGEYKRCISDTDIALKLFPENSQLWNQPIPNTEPSRTFKDMWSKIVTRRAEAFEHVENYQEALNSYQSLIEKSCFNDVIMEGKRRCQKVLNPPESKPAQPTASPRSSREPSASVPAPTKNYASVQRVKDDNRKEEALEAEKAALYDKVFDKVESWKGTKGDDIRHLLANLPQVLTWCDWKSVTTSELVLPKKVKVTYMKAVAKTHPDKIPASLDVEKKMLAENVFSTLSIAWEKFKSENDIN